MQQEIPDELGREVAKVAAGLNLGIKDAVREALESWVARVRQVRTRSPDIPIEDDMISPPVDLPRSDSRPVSTVRVSGRLPEGVGLE